MDSKPRAGRFSKPRIARSVPGLVPVEDGCQSLAWRDESDWMTALGRIGAEVGHEINNPLTFIHLNITQSLSELRPSVHALRALSGVAPLTAVQLEEIGARLVNVTEMLAECQVAGERIREAVDNLQRLSGQNREALVTLDINRLIEQSVARMWNQIHHRTQVRKNLGEIPAIRGNDAALEQAFLHILTNAAQAIPEGHEGRNEIRISTRVGIEEKRAEIIVEISDSGKGIEPQLMPQVFDPFFTTRPFGKGTGLGLSISRQTVRDHDGRMTIESDLNTGTTVRVFLPIREVENASLRR